MKANDLRVTNFVLNDGELNTILFIGYDSVHLMTRQGKQITAKLDSIQPIPLIDRWLEQLGFKKTTENAGNLICFKKDLITHSNRTMTIAEWIKSDKGHWQIWIESMDVTRIKYVHQLQNLYYALTVEELILEKK